MYGVPAELDLRFLNDATLTQVCIGPWDVQFHFHPIGGIFVQGAWELRDGGDGHRFRVEIAEVVHTHLNAEATLLVVDWWTPAGGLQKLERE